ncbi:MAG: hypothetical protein M3214_10615 [Actinomycetota bacterium]|nr:hypothetical protein [Actinomycetota bacterium]
MIGSIAVLALSLAACGGGDEGAATAAEETTTQAAVEPVTVELAEEHGSGQSGTATLTPVGEGAIPTFEVVISLTPPMDASLPAHIHDVTCAEYEAELDSVEEIEASIQTFLNDVRDGESTSTASGALEERTTGEYSINVHDPGRGQETVVCGDIPSS